MNASQFYQYIKNPDRMGIHDEVQLRGLLKEYPYFQSAQILLAKCLKNMDNYLFEKQLKLAALYAPNRSMLYTLLKNTDTNKQQAATSVQPTVAIPETTLEEANSSIEVSPGSITELPENTYEVFNIEPLAEDTYQHEFRAEDSPIAEETEEVNADETDDLRSFEEMRESLKNIISAIEERVGESPKSADTETAPPKEVQVDVPLQPDLIEPLATEPQVTQELAIPKPDTRDLQAAETLMEKELDKHHEKMLAATEVHSFADWLNLKSPSLEESKVLTKPTEEDIEKIDFVAALETRVAEPVAKPLLDMDSILENFIKHTPTISRPKAEFFNPVKSAKKSVEEDEDIATETLARIVLKQGNAPKAIRIYEKLILKYPDKSTIFAGQIEKIKQDNQLN